MTDVDRQHLRLLEAVLFASAEPLSERELAQRLPEDAAIPELLAALKADYADRGVNLVRAGKTWAFRTSQDLAAVLSRDKLTERRLSRAALETLAIIAYHQPVTRAEIEEIRGVQLSKGTLDVLFDQGWIRPKGRRQTPGRPVTWGTTDTFLDHFGLESLAELPGVDELKMAGLLDARPAIQIYGVTSEPEGAEEGDEEGDEDVDVDEDVDEDGANATSELERR
jgi:segregation and condensation protein B